MHGNQHVPSHSAIEECFHEMDEADSPDVSHSDDNPHVREHEARAAELLARHETEAAAIHQLLRRNMLRAAGEST